MHAPFLGRGSGYQILHFITPFNYPQLLDINKAVLKTKIRILWFYMCTCENKINAIGNEK